MLGLWCKVIGMDVYTGVNTISTPLGSVDRSVNRSVPEYRCSREAEVLGLWCKVIGMEMYTGVIYNLYTSGESHSLRCNPLQKIDRF